MSWENERYGLNVVANGRNWNAIRLLTGLGEKRAGHALTEVKMQLKETGVLVVLKKDSPKGPQVAFLEARDLDDALFVVAHAVKSKTIPWKADKFRTIRSD